MKKQFISIIMTLVMLASFIPCIASAAEPEIIDYDVAFTDGNYIINAELDSITNESKLIAAVYHSGVLAGINSEIITAGETSKKVIVPASDGNTANEIKLFIWDSLNNMNPQCESVTNCSGAELSAEDFDESESNNANSTLYFYPAGQTGSSIKYQLADNYTVYVNDREVTFSYNDIVRCISNEANSITLKKNSIADIAYSEIMINVYATAIVDEVFEKDEKLHINFKDQSEGIYSSMTVNKNNDSYTYFFKLNGEEIDPANLQEYDVLTIAYDYYDFGDSSFYDVTVSRDTIQGKCIEQNTSDEYKFNDTYYKISNGLYLSLEIGNDYILYLDCFGKIAYYEEVLADKNYAILKNIYQKANGDYYALIINNKGEEIEYNVNEKYINTADLPDIDGDFYTSYLNNWTSDKNSAVYDDTAGSPTSKLALYPKQVIEYSINSQNELVINGTEVLSGGNTSDTYNAANTRIGSIKLSDNTIILDITNADNDKIKVLSIDHLIDGNEYSIFAYDRSPNNATYPFVLLTEGVVIDDESEEVEIYEGYGILKNIYKAGKNFYALIINDDGHELRYKLDEKYVNTTDAKDEDKIYYTSYLNGWTSANNSAEYGDKRNLYPLQAIRYSVSSLNKVTVKEFLTGTETEAVYNGANSAFGTEVVSDTTVILDISYANSKNTVRSILKNQLVDNANYLFYGYGKADIDGTYPFIIIKDAPIVYDSTTQLAIFNSSEIVNYGEKDQLAYNVFINNELRQITINDNYNAPLLNEGDPIVFKTDSAGEINDVKLLFKDTNLLNNSTYDDIYDKLVINHETLLADDIDEFTQNNLSDKYDKVTFKLGVLVNRSGNNITLGTIDENGGVDYNAGIDMTVDMMKNIIYTYNFAAGGHNSSKVLLDEGIISTPKIHLATSDDILDLTHPDVKNYIVFALVRLIDSDEPQEIYLLTSGRD